MKKDLSQIPPREIMPGFHARFIHTERVTIGFVDIDNGSVLPEHQHVHEQTTTVLEGILELTIGGEVYRLEAGQSVTIPSQMPHAAIARSNCKVLDVFSPVREDYKY